MAVTAYAMYLHANHDSAGLGCRVYSESCTSLQHMRAKQHLQVMYIASIATHATLITRAEIYVEEKSGLMQDAKMFRRKKWKYLILDEAHMIKNWKSQRWQTLLNFNSKRRLLITGRSPPAPIMSRQQQNKAHLRPS